MTVSHFFIDGKIFTEFYELCQILGIERRKMNFIINNCISRVGWRKWKQRICKTYCHMLSVLIAYHWCNKLAPVWQVKAAQISAFNVQEGRSLNWVSVYPNKPSGFHSAKGVGHFSLSFLASAFLASFLSLKSYNFLKCYHRLNFQHRFSFTEKLSTRYRLLT